MRLIINESEIVSAPSVEDIRESIARVAKSRTGEFVTLEDSSDRDLNFIQARAEENGSGLLIEFQFTYPIRQYRLRRLAKPDEAFELFLQFIAGQLEPLENSYWRDITADIFGPEIKEIDKPLVL